MHLKEPKAEQRKVRVKHIATGEVDTVKLDMAKRLVASGDWEYVEGD